MLDNMATSLSVLTAPACHLPFKSRADQGRPGTMNRFPCWLVSISAVPPTCAALARPPAAGDDVGAAVAAIIADVRRGGDAAVRALNRAFQRVGRRHCGSGVARRRLRSSGSIPGCGRARVRPRSDRRLARGAAGDEPEHLRSGVRVREVVVPVDRVGCYVPGGRAPLASSVLMTALPARVAGRRHIALCTPPRADGTVHDAILAAAALAKVDAIYRVGGAQAIAALRVRDRDHRRGRRDRRPGHRLHRGGEAPGRDRRRDRQLRGPVRGGGRRRRDRWRRCWSRPTCSRRPSTVPAARRRSSPGTRTFAGAVEGELRTLLGADGTEAEGWLRAGGRVVLVDGPEQAMVAANAIAPEHLELMCAGAEDLVPLVRNAGAVFVGADASAVIGDYVAGVNHVLPTGGTALHRRAPRRRLPQARARRVARAGRAARARAVRDDAGRGRGPHRARRRDPPAGEVVTAARDARVQPRDDLRSLDGYHSPQVDVRVRLNTNESPYAPPDAFVARYTDALRDVAWHRYPDRGARELRDALGAFPRPTERATPVREREQRDPADAPAHLRRSGPARGDLRADVRAARAHRGDHQHRDRRRRAPRRLHGRRRRGDRARAQHATVARVPVQPQQPDRHRRAARDGRAAARGRRRESARCSSSTRRTASSRRGARSSSSTTTNPLVVVRTYSKVWSLAPRCGWASRWRPRG